MLCTGSNKVLLKLVFKKYTYKLFEQLHDLQTRLGFNNLDLV